MSRMVKERCGVRPDGPGIRKARIRGARFGKHELLVLENPGWVLIDVDSS